MIREGRHEQHFSESFSLQDRNKQIPGAFPIGAFELFLLARFHVGCFSPCTLR